MTYYYNYLNLPYKITGSENDETQFLYGADGSLLQRKYIKNSVQISKRDYLRDKEIVDNLMESIMHSDGRVIKNGNSWKYEYHIKDHLGNVRVTFSDNNGNGLLVSDEIKSRNDYYTFGLEWNNRWEQSNTISPLNLKRYNGKELIEDMNLGQLMFGARFLDREIGRWISPEPLVDEHTNISPYNYAMNNPIRYVDPDGRKIEDIIIRAKHNDGSNYVQRTFEQLQSLTTSKLKLDLKTGKVSIVEGDGNKKADVESTKIIDNLVKDETKIIEITNDVSNLGNDDLLDKNSFTIFNDRKNAMNGKGTGSTIYFSPDTKGEVTLEDGKRIVYPSNYTLLHESTHAENGRTGTAKTFVPQAPNKYGNEEIQTIDKVNLMTPLELKRYNGKGN